MINLYILPDDALLPYLKNRDKDAFSVIYTRYWPSLVHHAKRIVQDEPFAQDTVQDVFIWVLEHCSEMNITTSLKAYLYGAVRHSLLGKFRHEKIVQKYADEITEFQKNAFQLADQDFYAKELAIIVDAEIEKMPPKMKEVFNLSRKQYLSRKEIAALLNISEGTVRTQIQRALKILHHNSDLKR